MSLVKGKNVTIYAAGKIIACGRSCVLSTSTSFIETTTAGSGKGATYAPEKNNTTGSIEGVVFLNEANKLTLPELRAMQLKQSAFIGYYERIAEDFSHYFDSINFYIAALSDTGAAGDFNTFQMDIQVSGDPKIFVITSITATTFTVFQPLNIGDTYDISFDNGATYPVTGINTEIYPVTGLTHATNYNLVRRMHYASGQTEIIPALKIATM